MRPVVKELKDLCPTPRFAAQTARFNALREGFCGYFKGISDHARYFSSPASTEICGNQTVHNNGKVFAAGVDADIIAIAETFEDNFVIIKPEHSDEIKIDINDTEKHDDEMGTSAAIVRGILHLFKKNGLKVGGTRAYVSASAVRGVGLSVAAPFEVLIVRIFLSLFNDEVISPGKAADIAFSAEKEFFGEITNLTNQTACATGGFVAIDFKDKDTPIVENIPVDFSGYGHALCIVNLGTVPAYDKEVKEIEKEMKDIAAFFDCPTLRSLSISDVMLNINELRRDFGDRAVLRAIHFFRENGRVERLVHALRNDNFGDFLNAVTESGNSSYKYLQNVYSPNDVRHQDLSIALNTAEYALHGKGACRICSDGFSGCIQAFVPLEALVQFKMNMERTFGAGTCHAMSVRGVGVCEVLL